MAPTEAAPSTITIRVKVPPGYVEGGGDDFSVGSFDVKATVGHVRQKIQESLPSHPTPERQRLLFAGRALIDSEQTLAEALNTKRDSSQTEYVLHLIIRNEAGGIAVPQAQTHRRGVSMPTNGDDRPTTPASQQAQAQQTVPETPQQSQQPSDPSSAAHQAQLRQQTDAILQHLQHPHLHPQVRHQLILQLQQLGMAQRDAGMAPFTLPPIPPPMPMNWQPAMPMMPPLPQMPFMQQIPQPPGALRAGVGAPGFTQAVQLGQQQRAGMGMHGLGGQPYGQNTGSGGQQPQGQEGQPQDTEPTPSSAHGTQEAQQVSAARDTAEPPSQPAQQQTSQLPGIPPHMTNGAPRTQVRQHVQTWFVPNNGLPPQYTTWAQTGPQQQPPTAGPSALDRARENMAEMRRLIDDLRASSTAQGDGLEQQRARLGELQQAVNDYIDPMHFGVGNRQRQTPTAPPPSTPSAPRNQTPPMPMPGMAAPGTAPSIANMRYHAPSSQPQPSRLNFTAQRQASPTQTQATNLNNVECFLLSSPQGPQALLLSGQHGAYATAGFPGVLHQRNLNNIPPPTPTTQVTQAHAHQLAQIPYQQAPNAAEAPLPPPNQPVGPNMAEAAAQQQLQQQANPGVNALLGHFWLLLRILIFAYFLLGSNMGWRRPIALMLIGFGFWMVRMGLFGEGGVARRWWDDVMRVGPPPAQPQAAAAAEGDAPQPVAGGRPGMPTPEQVAQRLLDERRHVQNARVRWLRETLRPVERAVALFVASLWPGIGEEHVRAREQEERRRAEEEVQARRTEEEERGKREEEEKKKVEGAGAEKGSEAHVQQEEEKSRASGSSAAASASTRDGEKESEQ